jgi:hypothetical protein
MSNEELPKAVINLAKRLYYMARKYDGLSIVKVTYVVNSHGVPVFWVNPIVHHLEPRLEMDILSLEKKLGKDELQKVLHFLTNDL